MLSVAKMPFMLGFVMLGVVIPGVVVLSIMGPISKHTKLLWEGVNKGQNVL
jgi:hypothetical protein